MISRRELLSFLGLYPVAATIPVVVSPDIVNAAARAEMVRLAEWRERYQRCLKILAKPPTGLSRKLVEWMIDCARADPAYCQRLRRETPEDQAFVDWISEAVRSS
jgi:hypothetical protein